MAKESTETRPVRRARKRAAKKSSNGTHTVPLRVIHLDECPLVIGEQEYLPHKGQTFKIRPYSTMDTLQSSLDVLAQQIGQAQDGGDIRFEPDDAEATALALATISEVTEVRQRDLETLAQQIVEWDMTDGMGVALGPPSDPDSYGLLSPTEVAWLMAAIFIHTQSPSIQPLTSLTEEAARIGEERGN